MNKILTSMLMVMLSTPVYADAVIGLIGPFTGKSATFGEQMKRGGQQAIADINAGGGINGEKIVLHMADDACFSCQPGRQ